MTAPLDRRRFLAISTVGLAAVACSSSSEKGASSGTSGPGAGTQPLPPVPSLEASPFTLGVASGDPLPDSVILWTRLAPKPLEGGGMPDAPAPVRWEVSTDEAFGTVVAQGDAVAEPRYAHSVHVEAGGLRPDTAYWYRFRISDYTSPVGRTRTAPSAGSAPASGRLRFAFASCQDFQNGYYTAYPHLVADEPDLMVWLGDYIYEGGPPAQADDGAEKLLGGGTRIHASPEITDLAGYRNRYAQYNGDTDLQAARAACPWVVIWDDHEVENNYAADTDEKGGDPAAFERRRAQAYQAWWEHQPVRLPAPESADYRIYRTLDWGSLATFFALDERQYRSDQPCARPQDLGSTCEQRDAGGGSMLGEEQWQWLEQAWSSTRATWNVVANEVILTKMPLAGSLFNLDQWDGYPTDQARMGTLLGSRPDANPIVITGDIHAYGAAEVKASYDDPAAPAVAAEFVGGSVTSNFPDGLEDLAQKAIESLPQVEFVDVRNHGYALIDLAPDMATCRFRVVSTIKEPAADISTSATFEVVAGTPGLRRA